MIKYLLEKPGRWSVRASACRLGLFDGFEMASQKACSLGGIAGDGLPREVYLNAGSKFL